MNRFAAFLRISRLEYLAGGVFFLVAVGALGSGSFAQFLANASWIALGAALWLFCHLLGSQVNCLADYELDKAYKSHLPAAVDKLGKSSITWVVGAESVIAAAIALAFCRRTHDLMPIILFVSGWAITMAYSLEPIRLKRRGFLSPLALILVMYGLPVSLGYSALASHADLKIVAYLVAVGVQMFGVIVMNSLEDLFEDREAMIATPFVRYGLRRVGATAFAAYLVGAVASQILLWLLVPPSWIGRLVLVTMIGAHSWVLATIAVVLELDPKQPEEVRRAGKRNAAQFAVLGATFGAASLMVLTRH